MKKTFTQLYCAMAAFVLTGFFSTTAIAQCELYELDLQDASTYSITCGTTPGTNWKVTKGNNCTLTTSTISLPGDSTIDPNLDIPVSMRIDATGNCPAGATATWEYSVNGGGWATLQTISATSFSGTTTFEDTIPNVKAGADLAVRLTFDAVNPCTSWRLFEGDGFCISWPLYSGSMSQFTSLLPIELTYFEGEQEDNFIALAWATASEKNNDYFTILRSANGSTFIPLTDVDGVGESTSTVEYDHNDLSPTGGTNYYRLKQTDNNGATTESKIIAVNYKSGEDASCDFKVVPNPCIGGCDLHLVDCEEGNDHVNVAIFDAVGNIVNSNVPIGNGQNSYTINKYNNLAPGVYIVAGAAKDNQFNKKILVQ